MRPILFYLGPFPVHALGFFTAIGAVVGIFLATKEARRKGIDPSLFMDLCMYLLLGGIVGARLGYILLFNPAYYLANPLEIIMIHSGGLSIQGGIVGGILVGWWMARRHRILVWKLADTVAPGLIMGQAIGRTGCDVFGVPVGTNLPWAVAVNGQMLHPVQLYEVLLNYLLFLYLWRRRKAVQYDGQLFLTYVAAYAGIRGFVEFFRSNPILLGPFTIAHGVSFVFMAGAMVLMLIFCRKRRPNSLDPMAKEPLLPQVLLVGGAALLSVFFFYLLG